jgi:hypothetical protein
MFHPILDERCCQSTAQIRPVHYLADIFKLIPSFMTMTATGMFFFFKVHSSSRALLALPTNKARILCLDSL